MLMLPLSGCREVGKSNNNDNNNGKDKINAEEFFAVDNKQCSIKIKETYPDDKSGFMLTLEFETNLRIKPTFSISIMLRLMVSNAILTVHWNWLPEKR